MSRFPIISRLLLKKPNFGMLFSGKVVLLLVERFKLLTSSCSSELFLKVKFCISSSLISNSSCSGICKKSVYSLYAL